MSGQAGKWREDQILVICPGSKTTMAQLGCGELTPPTFRLPTRMFKDDESDEYRPYFVEKRKKPAAPADGTNGGAGADKAADEWEYVEDPDSDEGAIYPLRAGRVVNMEAFLAFLDHVHSLLTTTYHNTPIMLMASPQWTRPDCETITRYIFEKTKTPSLCLINSAVATQYGLRWQNMTVVDIGFEKVDVTCIFDSRVVNHREVGAPIDDAPGEAISGGEVFTRKLQQLLSDKDFTREMAEQLKKSPICEVLPYIADEPRLMELPKEHAAVAAAAAVPPPGAVLQVAQEPPAAAGTVAEPSRPAITTTDADDDAAAEGEKGDDNDGVLDVASIVTSGQTKEFLAKKEREKAERAEKAKARKAGKAAEADAQAMKAARLPNSKRMRNTFHYEELVREEAIQLSSEIAPKKPEPPQAPQAPLAGGAAAGGASADSAAATAPNGEASGAGGQPAVATESEEANGAAPAAAPAPAADAAPKPDEAMSWFPSGDPTAPPPSATERPVKRIRRDIEVGLERFLFADRAEIDRIVTAIYQAVQGIEDMYMRPACWENIVFVGNGCRLRGLRENIVQTLNARHLISPSTATMFTSELPSNLGTPQGTGAQTPATGGGSSFTGPPHQLPTSSSNVNQLLKEATTSAALGLTPGAAGPGGPTSGGVPGTNAPGSNAGDVGGVHSTHFHSQTPTAIRLAAMPTYLGEWTKNGYEEAMFLGAQVAARLAFCVHNMSAAELESQRLMSFSRVDYNEYGPKAIRTHSMLG